MTHYLPYTPEEMALFDAVLDVEDVAAEYGRALNRAEAAARRSRSRKAVDAYHVAVAELDAVHAALDIIRAQADAIPERVEAPAPGPAVEPHEQLTLAL